MNAIEYSRLQVVPVPLFAWASPIDCSPLKLQARPRLIFIPLFTSREYAMSFARLQNLYPSARLVALTTAKAIEIFLSGPMPKGVDLQVLFNPIELATGAGLARPLAELLQQLSRLQSDNAAVIQREFVTPAGLNT